jgi:glutathione synthase/RimK-type ligase-like ATP-grasp enzyme
MWTKIEVTPYESEIIYLPTQIAIGRKSIIVKFGNKTCVAAIEHYEHLTLDDENTFKDPGKIKISEKLKSKLLIPDMLVYRVIATDTCITFGPIIGFLLGIHTHRYNPSHMKKYSDRLGIYNKVGGLIYAFSPKSINWKAQTAYGLFYNIVSEAWEYGCFPLPEAIYRRDFHSSPKLVKKLIKLTNGKLFNSYRFTKFEMYDFIKTNKELSGYLPPTQLLTNFEQVRRFIELYPKIILKPVDLSRGRGICVIERFDNSYKISDYRYKEPMISVLHDYGAFENFFTLNQNFFDKYIVQQYLSLARIGSSLYDVRVVMQKQKDKSWLCTGIECRVSSNSLLTNISRGGYALTLDEALSKSFDSDYENLPQQIKDFCLKFSLFMDTQDEHYAEFGIDVAVDINKNLWLIEANVFPSFKGFKLTDRQTYLAIRYTPLIYALSLTQFNC